MSWNNRIFRHVKDGQTTYALHECYYDENGKPDGWTADTLFGHFESVEELITSLEMMLHDAERCKDNILDYEARKTTPTSPDGTA